MVDFVLDWQYMPDAKSVFESLGNGVKDAIVNYWQSAIGSNPNKAEWREINEQYLKEKADIEWEWLELERKARSLNAETLIQSVRQMQRQEQLEEIQLDQQQQQHPEIVELHKAALSLKRSELRQQQFLLEEYLYVMFQIQEKQVNLKLKELEAIEDHHNSRSQQSHTATQNLLLYDQDCLLLYKQIYYRVLVLVAPPAIADDPDIPQNLRGNLPLDLQDNIKEFLAQHYSLDLNAPVECHGDYFQEPISDLRVRELFHLLQPIPAIVLYPKLKDQALTFQLGHWGISGDAEAVDFAPKFTLNWQKLLKALPEQELTEKQAVNLLRRIIVDLHRLVAAYLVDLHYLAIDALAIYQPRLLELEAEFSLIAPQWADCAEMLRQVQAVRQKIYLPWHREQERIAQLKEQQRQIELWCCRETLGQDQHSGWVNAVAYSPDCRTLAAGYLDGAIKLWPLTRNHYRYPLTLTFEGHSRYVNTVAYSPDGNTLASGSSDNTIKIWHVATGQCIRTFEGHSQEVKIVVYSPDGLTLASGSRDETIKLWDVKRGECLGTLVSESHSSIFSLAYSPDPDGRNLISGGATIQLWDARTGYCLDTFPFDHSGWINAIAYSPDGRTLASASEDHTIKLWNPQTGKCLATLRGHSQSVESVAYSPDGRTLASASCDHTVKLWDLQKRSYPYSNLTGHTHVVNTVAYSPDGNTLASGSYDGSIKIWGFPLNQK